jgi:hypothetical protein
MQIPFRNVSENLPHREAVVGRIFIPSAFRGQLIKTFELSVRLRNVLEYKNIRLTGELHGLYYADFIKWRNCGRKTMIELQNLVGQLQSGSDEIDLLDQQPVPVNIPLLTVPPPVSDLMLSELPISVRLEKVLQKCGCQSLGNLNGVDVNDLLSIKNCGRKCILELRELIRRAEAGEFSAIESNDLKSNILEVSNAIDRGFTRLSERDRKIYKARLFGNNGKPRTLEDVALEFKMTRERVRQIVKVAIRKIQRGGGQKLGRSLKAIAGECQKCVCPLTAQLFSHWLGDCSTLQNSPQFYVCVLDHMDQVVPTWPPGSIRDGADDIQSEQIESALESWMRSGGIRPTANEAYVQLHQQSKFRNLSVESFLNILRRARRIIVNFLKPECLELQLRRIQMHFQEFALPLLEDSSKPLTFEEIVEKAKAKYGEESIGVCTRGIISSLTPEKGFFFLGPRLLGLQKHFLTSVSRRPELCNRFEKLLQLENRPFSTLEASEQQRIKGFEQISSYEMAHILRADRRFTDLGRHLFALTEWGVQEREYIKDLLPQVFAKANRALTVEQIFEKISRFRSVSPSSITNYLRKHSEIRSYGFGYFGLKSWNGLQKEVILRDRGAIENAVRRATPPMSFATLCDNLGIPANGIQAEILWKTCTGSSKLRRAPEKQSPETLLLHKYVSLEQSLATIARTMQHPAPAYELQWELNAKFGEIFAHIGLNEIEDRLARSKLFLQNNAGEFLLDESADLGDFDPEALCAACIKSLSESRNFATCDELIERLEVQGFELDELSADMLASILRGAKGLQEVGHQRFRARQ